MRTGTRTWTIRSLPVALAALACATPARAITGGPTLLERTTVVSADTARDCFNAVRYRVRALWTGVGVFEFEFDCFHRTDVAVKSVLRVSGRSVLLLVVSFIGDCYEGGGYETQEPVLLADPAVKTRHVPWRGTG